MYQFASAQVLHVDSRVTLEVWAWSQHPQGCLVSWEHSRWLTWRYVHKRFVVCVLWRNVVDATSTQCEGGGINWENILINALTLGLVCSIWFKIAFFCRCFSRSLCCRSSIRNLWSRRLFLCSSLRHRSDDNWNLMSVSLFFISASLRARRKFLSDSWRQSSVFWSSSNCWCSPVTTERERTRG